MQKILLTVPNLDAAASPWREAMGLARYLPAHGVQLTVCALRPDGLSEEKPALEAAGVKCFSARFRPRGKNLRAFVACFKDGRQIKGHGPFDVQHSMDFTASPIEAMMSRRHARRFVFSQRNMNRNGSRALLKVKAGLGRRILCVSDAVLGLMERLGLSGKLAKIYPGIEVDRIPWQPPCDGPGGAFRLLMVGHIARLKRFEDGIETVARLAPSMPGLRLDIAGQVIDAVYERELMDRIEAGGIRGRVTFLGRRKDILDVMRRSHALLHTAETEAFGMAILEAMAVGLPVIAPAIEGPKELIESQQSGLLAPPGDVGAYAEAVLALARGVETRARLSASARQRVEKHFSAQRMAEETAQVYRSLQ
ncbi:MAG TPA: glycosyltransferase family 4 protein [Verrucomicrobiae bacterium]|jgi:glycosyltransferase involved in cell wall biosynthesis